MSKHFLLVIVLHTANSGYMALLTYADLHGKEISFLLVQLYKRLERERSIAPFS